MKKIYWLLLLVSPVALVAQSVFTQQTFDVREKQPVLLEGLQSGYEIIDSSSKEVGKKGEFSRYKIRFFVTNTTTEAKILYQKPGFMGHAGPISSTLVLFKCANATGARFTNKQRSLDLLPCKLLADVEDIDSVTHKKVINRRLVDIGYFIKPGETISTTTIMIVPLNEKPQMTAVFYPEVHQQTGSLISAAEQVAPVIDFVRIKNFAAGKYLNNQSSPLDCTPIDRDWWSAQWQIIPVNGTSNFQIQNRWKLTYLSTENSSMVSANGQTANAMWQLEETSINNVYAIRNLADNSKLVYQNNTIRASNSYNNQEAAGQWIIEKQ